MRVATSGVPPGKVRHDMGYAGSGDMANADAGHDFDELDRRLDEADQAVHKAHQAMTDLANHADGLNYPDDAVGSDTRRFVEDCLHNRIGEANELMARVDKLNADARAAQRLQTGVDEQSADALARAVPKE